MAPFGVVLVQRIEIKYIKLKYSTKLKQIHHKQVDCQMWKYMP
jgi:hypothetical protein